MRYLDHRLNDFKVYSITLLDNHSRATIASGFSRTQDLSAFLRVFYNGGTVARHPEALVTDNGGVFPAKEVQRIHRAPGIREEGIARWQPWQSSIKTAFGVQRRMAARVFARVGTWPELLAIHDWWVADHNDQDDCAHHASARRLAEPRCGAARPKTYTSSSTRRAAGTSWRGRVCVHAVPPLARLRGARAARRSRRRLALRRVPDAGL